MLGSCILITDIKSGAHSERLFSNDSSEQAISEFIKDELVTEDKIYELVQQTHRFFKRNRPA